VTEKQLPYDYSVHKKVATVNFLFSRKETATAIKRDSGVIFMLKCTDCNKIAMNVRIVSHLAHNAFNDERTDMLALTACRDSEIGYLNGIEKGLEPIGAVCIWGILRTGLRTFLHLVLDNLRQAKVMLVKAVHGNNLFAFTNDIHLATAHPDIILKFLMDKFVHGFDATRKP